ncbi:hypothetical protein BGZ98_008447 [Dissophora globulifera]|nr:hypothetical protein BGZ98_008447 [Dissophora globulifera]
MVATQELLCILSVVGYFIPLCGFLVRYARSRWPVYLLFGFFCILRIVAYILGAYYNSPAVVFGSLRYINLFIADVTLVSVGAIHMLICIGQLYHSIVPKIFQHHNHTMTAFETFAFVHIRIPFFPFAGCLIAGTILANPTYSLVLQERGVILRKFAILMLLAISLLFLYISTAYHFRYPEHKAAFATTGTATFFLTLAVIYKVITTFDVSTSESVWAAYVFAPLVEVIALAIFSVDLQTLFLGHTKDQVITDEEQGHGENKTSPTEKH